MLGIGNIGKLGRIGQSANKAAAKRILDIFSTTPVYDVDGWYFIDKSEYNHNIKIINSPCLNFVANTQFVNSNLTITGKTHFNFKIKMLWKYNGLSQKIFRVGGVNLKPGISADINADGDISIYITSLTLNEERLYQIGLTNDTFYEIEFNWAGTKNDVFKINVNGTVYERIIPNDWDGDSFEVFKVGYKNLFAEVYYAKLNNQFEYYFIHNYGTIAYNNLGSTNGTLTAESLWGLSAGSPEPVHYTKGVSIFSLNTNPSQLIFIVGNVENVNKYTKIAYYQPNSGIIKSIPNKYVIPESVILNNFITAGNKTYDDLDSLTPDNNLIVKKTENTINQIIVKNKIINSIMLNKEFYTVGDSLSLSGVYQNKLSVLANAYFDTTKNINVAAPLSIGGTGTRGYDESCGQWRIQNLFNNYPNAEVVIYQNINDYHHGIGASDMLPFMLENIVKLSDVGLHNAIEAENYWNTNFASIVSEITPKKGTAINIPFYAAGKNVKITGLPTANGNVKLRVNGKDYGIAVTTDDTIASLVNKILEYQYGLVNDGANADGESVDFFYSSGVTITYTDTDNTGLTVSITDTTTAQAFYYRYFKGQNIEIDWTDITKWSGTLYLYETYKGLFAYMNEKFPNAAKYLLITTRFAIEIANFESYEAWAATSDAISYATFVEFQKTMCELYNIIPIDLTILNEHIFNNFSTYYNDNNVHPKNAGYELWGYNI